MHYGTEAGIGIAGRGNILRLDCWEEEEDGGEWKFVRRCLAFSDCRHVGYCYRYCDGRCSVLPLSFSRSLPPPSSPLPYIRFLSNIALTPAL